MSRNFKRLSVFGVCFVAQLLEAAAFPLRYRDHRLNNSKAVLGRRHSSHTSLTGQHDGRLESSTALRRASLWSHRGVSPAPKRTRMFYWDHVSEFGGKTKQKSPGDSNFKIEKGYTLRRGRQGTNESHYDESNCEGVLAPGDPETTVGGSGDTLDQLQTAIHALELEVEELRIETDAENDLVIGTCTFTREGSRREPAMEGRDTLLYLPGLDGLNVEALEQFDFLSEFFDVWCMTVKSNDKSTFEDLTAKVVEFMDVVGVDEQRQAVIVGSSFGGLLGVNLAHQCQEFIKGLVLVNPATSYDRSRWRLVGPIIANAPGSEAFGVAATLTLAAVVPDTAMVARYMRELVALPPQEVTAWFGSLTHEWFGRVSSLYNKTPREQLQWRLKHWLEAGSARAGPLLREIPLPVLVLAGGEDHILPSVDEAARLSDLIPTCQQVILRGVGHAALQDPGEVDLCALIRTSVIYDENLLHQVINSKEARRVPKRWHPEDDHNGDEGVGVASSQNVGTGDPVVNFKLDLDDDMVSLAWRSTEIMDHFTSPVFLSTNKRGELQHGLAGVPDHEEGRSILFVGNHQLLGIDMPILVRKMLLEKDILVRGLAHPVVTGDGSGDFIASIQDQYKSTTEHAMEFKTATERRGVFGTARRGALWVIHAAARVAGRAEASGADGAKGVIRASGKMMASASSIARRVFRRSRRGKHRRKECDGSTPPSSMRELLRDFMAKVGAVPVTPRNMIKLLKAGDAVLLYPGGAKEALHQKGQEYTMFWPERTEFARMAAAFNATIVPFAAIGSSDSAEIMLDLNDIFSLPFGFGETMQNAADLIPRARRGDDQEYFLPPLARPKVPARHYFVFARPIDTTYVDESDRDACHAVYDEARSSVAAGIRYLLDAREHDPYHDTIKRILYETVMKTQAPIFPLDAASAEGLR